MYKSVVHLVPFHGKFDHQENTLEIWEEALVDYNMHFKRYGSFGVLVQQERNMNHDSYTGKRNLGRGIFGFLEVGSFDERLEN